MKLMPDLKPVTRLFMTRIGTSHHTILHSIGYPVCFQPGVDRKFSVESIALFYINKSLTWCKLCSL